MWAAGLDVPVLESPIAPAFSSWTVLNERLLSCVASLTSEDLDLSAGPGRWPIWAVVGHAACQRVFWLCDFAGESGASSTPFTQAAWNCPGDDDLENVLSAAELGAALTSTFDIVAGALSRWTLTSLDEVLSRPEWGPGWTHTRGAVIQRVHDHDLWHAAELNEALTRHGRPAIDLWS